MATTDVKNESQLPQLIVGGGIGGVDTAIAFQEYNVPYVIFEKSSFTGGVWNMSNKACGLANIESHTQTDPVIFAPAGWYLDEKHQIDASDPFRGINTSVEACQEINREVAQKAKVEVQYNRQVIDFENNNDGTVNVTWEDTLSGELHVEKFAGLHFRAGNLNKHRRPVFPGQEEFKGEIKMGCFNETTPYDKTYNGKEVVIVGWGSFAVECAQSAIKHGAKAVHIVSRSDKHHWFDYATYIGTSFYSPAIVNPEHVPAVWEKAFDINETVVDACGVRDVFLNKDTYGTVNGKRHMIVSQGGFPNFCADPVAIAMHYGLVQYHRGEIAEVRKDKVVTSNGEEISCDLIVITTGFYPELGMLNGHYMKDGIFVDGQVNITSTHANDGCDEEAFFGPSVPVTNSVILSIHIESDFDRMIAYFLNNREKYQAFTDLDMFTRVKKPESVGYIAYMYLFSKIFAFGDEHIIGVYMKSMGIKQEEYKKVLDEQIFLKYNKQKWDAWSSLCAERTGKPLLEYPFIARMKELSDIEDLDDSSFEDEKKSPN